MAIGSNSTTLSFEDVVALLLSEEMRLKNMEGSTKDALSVRIVRPIDEGNAKSFKGRSRGRLKSTGKSTRKCWKCGKVGHFKKDYSVKTTDKRKGFDESQSTK